MTLELKTLHIKPTNPDVFDRNKRYSPHGWHRFFRSVKSRNHENEKRERERERERAVLHYITKHAYRQYQITFPGGHFLALYGGLIRKVGDGLRLKSEDY